MVFLRKDKGLKVEDFSFDIRHSLLSFFCSQSMIDKINKNIVYPRMINIISLKIQYNWSFPPFSTFTGSKNPFYRFLNLYYGFSRSELILKHNFPELNLNQRLALVSDSLVQNFKFSLWKSTLTFNLRIMMFKILDLNWLLFSWKYLNKKNLNGNYLKNFKNTELSCISEIIHQYKKV